MMRIVVIDIWTILSGTILPDQHDHHGVVPDCPRPQFDWRSEGSYACIQTCLRPIAQSNSCSGLTRTNSGCLRHRQGGLAERVGFEPTVPARGTTVFETAPIDHSGTSPHEKR